MQLPHQNLPRDLLERAPVPALTTIDGVVMSVVYVTAPATFTGVIGGYTVLDSDDGDTRTQSTSTRASSSVSHSTVSSLTQSRSSSSSSRATVFSTSALVSSVTSTSLTATALLTSSYSYSSPTNTAVSGASTTSSSSSSSSSSTGGLSIGAQIGIAVGVILGVSIAAGLILLLLARKKRQQKMQSQAVSEKKDMSNQPPIALTPTKPVANQAPDAPRLSLRPVSDLVPEFMGGARQKNRTSQGNMLTPISEAASARARNASPVPLASQAPRPSADRPRRTDNPFKDPENPFADPEKAMMAQAPINNNLGNPGPVPSVAGAAAVTGEVVTDQRISGPSAESFPLPQSSPSQAVESVPALAIFPARKPAPTLAPIAVPNTTYAELPAAPSPVVAQGPGPEAPQGSVYRILLDFRPTMEDELELRAGQLVRLLHEYDDGWALCIRMDRSQQGVVPRTCLAAKPSKPRAGPPPMGPSSRPMTPQGRSRGPQGPPGFASPRASIQSQVRAQSPAPVASNTGAFNQPPRPLSPGPRPQPPAQKRSMSPGPYAAGGPVPMAVVDPRRRSNSVDALPPKSNTNSPPGPSKLGPGPSSSSDDGPGLAI